MHNSLSQLSLFLLIETLFVFNVEEGRRQVTRGACLGFTTFVLFRYQIDKIGPVTALPRSPKFLSATLFDFIRFLRALCI